MGVPVRQRLRRSAEFTAVRNEDRRAVCNLFALQINEPAQTDPTHRRERRLGVIASRRVGNAVVRNRCKRLLREAFRKHQNLLPEVCDVVLVARRHCGNAEIGDVSHEFVRLATKLSHKNSPRG